MLIGSAGEKGVHREAGAKVHEHTNAHVAAPQNSVQQVARRTADMYTRARMLLVPDANREKEATYP